MAKVKTAKEIKEEASRVMSDAKKQHRELMKKAAELEEKKYVELGKKCVEFLKGNATQSDLKTMAVNSDLLVGGDGMSFAKKEDIESSLNNDTGTIVVDDKELDASEREL